MVDSGCTGAYSAISSTAECDAAGAALGFTLGPWANHGYGGSCAKWNGGWGTWGGAWYWYTASTQPDASLICAVVTGSIPATPYPTAFPTPSPPTPSPTPYPTPSPTPSP